jgi:hypothetical protein
MGLIVLEQDGRKAYRAKLLYKAELFTESRLTKKQSAEVDAEIEAIMACDDTGEILAAQAA